MSETNGNGQKREVRGVKLKLMEKAIKKNPEAKEKEEVDMLFIPEIIIYNPDRKRDELYNNCANYCHRDFVKAVLALRDHFAILLDFYAYEDFETDAIDGKKFKARGFSLSGAEDELRVCLKGHFITQLAGAITVNVNNIYLNKDMDAEGGYDLIDDLKVKIDRIKLEALQYLFNGKQMEDSQLSMKFDDDKVTKAQVLPAAKPGENGTFKNESATSVGSVAAAIVDETNKAQLQNKGNGKSTKEETSGKKLPQTADNKTGAPKK